MIDKVFRPQKPKPAWCAWCKAPVGDDPTKPCEACGMYGRTYIRPSRKGPGA